MGTAIVDQSRQDKQEAVKSGFAGGGSALNDLQFPPRPPRMALSLQETAETLGVSEKTIRRLVARQLLHPSGALRHLLFSVKEVERFLEDTTR